MPGGAAGERSGSTRAHVSLGQAKRRVPF